MPRYPFHLGFDVHIYLRYHFCSILEKSTPAAEGRVLLGVPWCTRVACDASPKRRFVRWDVNEVPETERSEQAPHINNSRTRGAIGVGNTFFL